MRNVTKPGLRHIAVATQTKSVAKRNKRVQTSAITTTPRDLSHVDVELSLCGKDRLEEFEEHKLTYHVVKDDINVLYNHDLVVRVGKEFYVWSEMPDEVLAAIAFREFRGGEEEPG